MCLMISHEHDSWWLLRRSIWHCTTELRVTCMHVWETYILSCIFIRECRAIASYRNVDLATALPLQIRW